MTNLNDFLRRFERSFIGYDAILDAMTWEAGTTFKGETTNFPPYNIRKLSDTKYAIEMAVAGFGKQDVTIDLDGDKLKISGSIAKESDNNYLFRGLAARDFTRSFTLNDHVVVNNATLMNGILKVFLERIVPEEKKPRRIDIEDEPASVSEFAANNAPQLLTEDDRSTAEGKLM